MGSYAILGRVGEGGMGAVYLGQGPDGNRVAVKVVRPELAQDSGFVARFQDEVANAQRVASFCTAQVLDHGESDGRAFMVTEYIDGVSLKQYVDENGELSQGMIQGVAVGVAAALVAIHAAGLIHRDLKPANVLLSFSGPRVIDFGIARALDAASGHTMTGQLVGSPGWMAPEQILQKPTTTAVDIFAWGCLVAFARNGVNPFGKGDFSVMSARLVHGDPQVGSLPSPLERLVKAALDKEPRNRPTAKELLLTIVGGESAEAAVMGTLVPGWQPPVPPPTPGATRVMDEPTRESHPSQDSPAPTAYAPGSAPGGRGQAAYGAIPAPGGQGSAQSGPNTPSPQGGHSTPSGQRGHGTPSAQGGQGTPSAHGGQGSRSAQGGAALRGYGVASAPGGFAAGLGSVPTEFAPVAASTDTPTRPTTSRGGPSRGRWAGLAAAVALVLAAVTVGGWVMFQPHDKPHSGSSAKAKTTSPPGPPALPTDPMLVRVDRAAGWPNTCHGNIGLLTPGAAQAKLLLDAPDKCDILPQWSPDHRHIAFTRSRGAIINELWVMNADGSSPVMVTDRLAGRSRVAWSGDGTKLAAMVKVGTERQIYTVSISAPQQLEEITTDGSNKDDPAWCGSRLAFWSDKTGTSQIYTTDANTTGGTWTPVTTENHPVNDPAWSPDCTKIAYTDQPNANDRHIWTIGADGTNKRQLTSDNARDMDPNWSREGTWVAFVRGATEHPRIWAVRADGSGAERVAPAGNDIGHPDWY